MTRGLWEVSAGFRWVGIILAALLTGLPACGWHLRGVVDLPEGMDVVYVNGFGQGSPFMGYFIQNLRFGNGRVTRDLGEASFVLNAISQQFSRREATLSSTGRANTYQLTYELIFDLQTTSGDLILSEQIIRVAREYYNPQSDVIGNSNIIGKAEEENVIHNEMYKEAVNSVLRRAEVALRNYSTGL
jgi:LPS-assembly lipoprotein